MTNIVQFIKLFMNMKIWINIEKNGILHDKQWEWHNVPSILVLKHYGDGYNEHGYGEAWWWKWMRIFWCSWMRVLIPWIHDEACAIYQVLYEYENLNQHRNTWCFVSQEVGWNNVRCMVFMKNDGDGENDYGDGEPWWWWPMRILWCTWIREKKQRQWIYDQSCAIYQVVYEYEQLNQ